MTTSIIPAATVSSLRQRLTADMTMRRFSAETQRNHLRDVERPASFLGRSPDTASAEDLRRFQIALQEAGLGVPTMNAIVSALRFSSSRRSTGPISPASWCGCATPAACPMCSAPTTCAACWAPPSA